MSKFKPYVYFDLTEKPRHVQDTLTKYSRKNDMTLQEIWNYLNAMGYGSDKGDVHDYIPVYEEILKPYRKPKVNVLEIGLFKGNSLRMWKEYFSEGNVYGVDCSETPVDGMADLRPMIEEGIYNIRIFDACNPVEVANHFRSIRFDVIIDDAAHSVEQQVELFNVFNPYMNEGGIYIVEDIQDIDRDRKVFESLSNEHKIEIIDRRNVKNRYDDVLVTVQF